MGYLHEAKNEYGSIVSAFKCDFCGNEFTVCPSIESSRRAEWAGCMAPECGSYDSDRDADVLFMSDDEISNEKPVVSIVKLRQRRAMQRRSPK